MAAQSAATISTVAGSGGFGDGGAATAARFDTPHGVAVDGDGNLYIADTNNNRIRKVTASSGNISTVAGTGGADYSGDGGAAADAQLDAPYDVAVDGDGNLYVADTNNNRIRKVTASSGNISTVAGTGGAGYSGDGGAAADAALDGPRGLAVDGAGNIYIADQYNDRIRSVNTSGNISTFAGGGSSLGDGGAASQAQLANPQDVAVDGAGNLYIVDSSNGRIRKVDTSANISTAAGGATDIGDGGSARSAAAWLNGPDGVTVDSAGNLYIADTLHHRVRMVNPAGKITTAAGTGDAGYSGDNGAAAEAELSRPKDVAVDSAGNLYIADMGNHRIRKVNRSGIITTVAGTGENGVIATPSFDGRGGPATNAPLSRPEGVALDEAGNLYIADTGNALILKVDTRGIITVEAGGIPDLPGEEQPRPSPDLPPEEGVEATGVRLRSPTGVAVHRSTIYIADRGNSRVRRVSSAGRIYTVAGIADESGNGIAGYGGDGGPANKAMLDNPYDVAVDEAGNLYIAEFGNHRIRRVRGGTITTAVGTGVAGFSGDGGAARTARINSPTGVAVDGAGNLYIADNYNHRIRKVDSAVGALPREPAPAASPTVFELSFAPAAGADPSEPMSQALTLQAAEGAADFEVLTSARWIEISRWEGVVSWKGRLAAGETITLRVTVNPLGLRAGTHRGYVYIRSGGRTARVRIVLEVPPPTGPDVSESGGVVNAARMSAYGEAGLFGPQILPLAPGSLVAVQGVNFASGETVLAAGFPLPTSLGGARVLFEGMEAPLISVGPRRIEAQLPSVLGREALAAGGLALAEVVVEAGGESSYPRRFWVAPSAPGVFTASGTGQGQAAVMFAGTTDLAAPLGSSEGSRPARAGDVLEIYATGLGAVEPPLTDGMNSCAPDGVCLADGSNVVLRHTAARPRVWIGAHELAAENIRFSGLAPSLAGMNLVMVEVPPNLAPSSAAELRLAIGGRISQSGVTIAVE